MDYKRLTLLSGHYGSGKTNIAVNMAFDLRKSKDRVAIADLDIVNPYFRTRDSEQELAEADIRLICSSYANTNLDAPAMPQEMYALVDDTGLSAIVDVGGDDRGALALGRISDAIREEGNYDMYLVINCYRPLTPDAESTLEVLQEIEAACRLPFTAIINNSNLAAETTPESVLASLDYAEAVSKATGLPIRLTTVEASLYDALKDKIPNLFPMKLQKRPV